MDETTLTYDEVISLYTWGFSAPVVDPERRRAKTRRPWSNEEPSLDEIDSYMAENPGLGWYNAREELRSIAYGGSRDAKPPWGDSWGMYWKMY